MGQAYSNNQRGGLYLKGEKEETSTLMPRFPRAQKDRNPKEETAGEGTGLEDFLVEANLKSCRRFAVGKSESRTD